jgi:hypothetical protein
LKECHYSCKECTGSTYIDCVSCGNQEDSYRTLEGSSCRCLNGFFDSGLAICQSIKIRLNFV